MEEVWQQRYPSETHSVHLERFRNAPESWKNEALATHIETVREFRSSANEATEPLRKDKVIKSSLEAAISAPADKELVKALTALNISRQEVYSDPADPNDTLADLLIVSDVNLSAKAEEITVVSLAENKNWIKCKRSWKYFKGDGEITPRDAAAVAAWESSP